MLFQKYQNLLLKEASENDLQNIAKGRFKSKPMPLVGSMIEQNPPPNSESNHPNNAAMMRLPKRWIGVFSLFLFGFAPLWAQTTGKVTGKVFDAQFNSPMPGATIKILGTSQGAMTDANGEYVIIGVRPGVYVLEVSFVGYVTEKREQINVNIGLTTTADFKLREQVIASEKEVVIVADAIKVRKDVTSSESRVSAQTIDNMPVQELGQLVGAQAGVTSKNGSLHIRGGRSSEVKVLVDGVAVTDSYDGSQSVQIENEGIQELQVISGTFNAEHGNAMSGVINVVTKEGGNTKWGGSAEWYSGSYLVNGKGGQDYLRGINAGDYTVRGVQYRDVDPYGYLPKNPLHYQNAKLAIDGPIIKDRVSLFALARYFKNDGWFYGVRKYNIDGTRGDSALVPMNNFERLSVQANFKIALRKGMFINLIGLANQSESRNGDFGLRWAPDGRGRNQDLGYDVKAKFTHLVSNKTFYNIDVGMFFRNAKGGLYDDPFDKRYNNFMGQPPDSVEVVPGVWETVTRGGSRFQRGGTDLGRYDRDTRSQILQGSLSSQISKHHLVKVGFEAKQDIMNLKAYGLIPKVDADGNPIVPFEPAIPDETSLDFSSFSDIKPFSASAYIQDKMEYEDLIINAGLRFDYFDSNGQILADPSDPNVYAPFKKTNIYKDTNNNGVIDAAEEVESNKKTLEERLAYWYNDASPKFQLSPRLGVAYPITEKGVIHFSYGHFLQIPTLNRLFDNYGYKIRTNSGTYGPFGNPDLKAQKTVMYEIGVRQGFGDYVVDVTAYYRDVRNWVATSPVITTEIPGTTYVNFANRDYANTRGMTLSFNKTYSNNWGADLSYTFQVVEGSNSNPNDEFFSMLNNSQPTIALLPLDWDQRHRLAGSAYTNIAGWGASVLFSFGSGFPFTPSFGKASLFGANVQPEFARNSRRMPSEFSVDLNLNREFKLGPVKPKFFLQVFNLLDRRNVTGVYGDTGKPNIQLQVRDTSSHDPGFWIRPFNYSEPRRAHLGVEFKF